MNNNHIAKNSGDFLKMIDDEELKQEDSIQEIYQNA